MVTDLQVRRLRKLMSKGYTLSSSAAKASIDEKTAHKYLNSENLPSEMSSPHTWRNPRRSLRRHLGESAAAPGGESGA